MQMKIGTFLSSYVFPPLCPIFSHFLPSSGYFLPLYNYIEPKLQKAMHVLQWHRIIISQATKVLDHLFFVTGCCMWQKCMKYLCVIICGAVEMRIFAGFGKFEAVPDA